MSHHVTTGSSQHESQHQRSWEWWLIIAVGLIAAGFGFFGMREYEINEHGHADLWSVGYHTLQLFLLHAPHLEKEVPWALHLGRWLAAGVVLTAVAKGLMTVFRSECRLFWARWRSGHIVICGLGRLGLQLAREFRRSGRRVVAIEAKSPVEHTTIARDIGVAVLTGDACDVSELRRAAVARAWQVIAVCDDEQTNVAVATAVGELLLKPGSRKQSLGALECWMFIPDARLRRLFQQERLFPNTSNDYRVNVRGLDLFEIAARQALARSPLDFERVQAADSTIVHMVIVGFGPVGQHLALQAARIGHFANLQKLQMTVMERSGSPRPDEFLKRHPGIKEICDFKTKDISVEGSDSASQLAALTASLNGVKELTTFAVCWDSPDDSATGETDMFQRLEHDDPTNLSLALDLAKHLQAGDRRILLFQTRKCGFGALFPVEGRGEAIGAKMHAFGMLEETCTLDTLLHEREDAIAKELHADYYDKQIRGGKTHGSKPALYLWDELADRFKESNRRAADHIPVKLRAIGYRVDQLRKDQPRITALDDDKHSDPHGHVELLAKMEHERWSADMLLQNFELGDRNDAGKKHDCLKSWAELPDGTRDWDRQQVRVIPTALERAGYGIYPQIQ